MSQGATYHLADALPANNDDQQFLPGSFSKMLYYFVDLYTNLVVFWTLQVTHIAFPMRCQPTMMTSSFFRWKVMSPS
jgi:hypothetical protein